MIVQGRHRDTFIPKNCQKLLKLFIKNIVYVLQLHMVLEDDGQFPVDWVEQWNNKYFPNLPSNVFADSLRDIIIVLEMTWNMNHVFQFN